MRERAQRAELAQRDPGEGAGAGSLRILAGPTASGKSALAIAVARASGAEVLSMDSMLVYRGMDIGTAKPTPAELSLAGVRSRGRRALFVGGTAFYLKALVAGLFRGPDVDPALRAALEERFESEGAAAIHAELGRVDPLSAARLHPNDRKRVVRALEVWQQTGRPLSDWQREWGWGGAPAGAERAHVLVALSIAPGELEGRIRARTRAMLEGGWVEEVRRILARGGFGPTARQALGYAEVVELAQGRLARAEAEERIAVRTRRFARKQRTWLRQLAPRHEVRAPAHEHAADMQRAAGEVLAALGW